MNETQTVILVLAVVLIILVLVYQYHRTKQTDPDDESCDGPDCHDDGVIRDFEGCCDLLPDSPDDFTWVEYEFPSGQCVFTVNPTDLVPAISPYEGAFFDLTWSNIVHSQSGNTIYLLRWFPTDPETAALGYFQGFAIRNHAEVATNGGLVAQRPLMGLIGYEYTFENTPVVCAKPIEIGALMSMNETTGAVRMFWNSTSGDYTHFAISAVVSASYTCGDDPVYPGGPNLHLGGVFPTTVFGTDLTFPLIIPNNVNPPGVSYSIIELKAYAFKECSALPAVTDTGICPV